MEKRRITATARKKKDATKANAVRAAVAFLTVAAAAYVALATSVGSFMAEKVFAPLFYSMAGSEADAASSPAATDAQGDSLSLSPHDSSVAAGGTTNFTVGERTYYAIQLGAYKNEDNALACANEMRLRAAGGFVHSDGEHYRVLAAVYGSVDDARTVKSQLLEINGVDSSIYTVTVPAAAMQLTAPVEKRTAVEGGFLALASVCDGMLELTNEYDLRQITNDEAAERINGFLSELSTPAEALSGVSDDVASKLRELLLKFEHELSACLAHKSENYVAFSSLLKYTHIDEVCSYREFMTSLALHT